MKRVKHWITRLAEAVWRSAKWLAKTVWRSAKWLAKAVWWLVKGLAKTVWWLTIRPTELARAWNKAMEEAKDQAVEEAKEKVMELERERGLDLESARDLERARERARELERKRKRERASFGPYQWWKHPPRGRVGTHIGRYDDPAKMDTEVAAASAFGWTVKNVAATGSHINVGRTVAPAAMTGGLSLLLGASRTKEKYIVTFEHDGRVAAA